MVRKLAPYAVLAIAWAGILVYAFPGYMSFDSFDQLRQARAGSYGDWHPPAMAALWRIVEYVHSGPLGMLLLQTGCFLAGAFLLMRRYLSPLGAAIAALAVLWFPPLGTLLAVIWKDSQMIGYATLGIALLGTPSWRRTTAGLLLLGVATAMRHNAFAITAAPVVLLTTYSPLHRRLVRYGLAVACWLAITVGASAINAALTDYHQRPWASSVALFDIIGTIHYAGDISDAELDDILAGTTCQVTTNVQSQISAAYNPSTGVLFAWNRHVFEQLDNDAQGDATTAAWRKLVLDHPWAYLHHRWRSLVVQLEIYAGLPERVWVGFDDIGQDLLEDPAPAWQQPLRDAALWFGKSWLFRPWPYLALLLAAIPLVSRARDRTLTALVASALMSEALLFLVAPVASFRYSVWLVEVTAVVWIALVSIRHGAVRDLRESPVVASG